MGEILIALLQGVLLVLLAPLVSGVTRWMRAKMHTRRGPSIWQDYYDIAKLLKRQDVFSNASSWVMRFMPPVFMGTMILLAMGMPAFTRFCPVPLLGDVVFLLYMLALPRFFFALAGLDSGSAYAGTGATRELIMGTLVEPSLMLALFVAAISCGTTNVGDMGQVIAAGQCQNPIALVVAGVAFAVACYIELGKLPYDLAESEQELQEGPLAEYSGPSLAMLHLAMPMKQIVVVSWFVAIFLPFGSAVDLSAIGLLVGVGVYVAKVAVIFFICAIIENVVCRVRFKLVGRQTWFVVAIAVCAFAFCALGI